MDIDDIGEDTDALVCHTNKTGCCGTPKKREGEWYFPGGQMVPPGRESMDAFYRDRDDQIIRLNRDGMPSERGRFQCEVPDSMGVMHSLSINIGMLSIIITH